MKIEGSNSAAHDADYDNSDGRAACSINSGHYGVLLGTKYPNGNISSQNQKIDQLGMRSKKGHMIRKVRKVWHNILQRRETCRFSQLLAVKGRAFFHTHSGAKAKIQVS